MKKLWLIKVPFFVLVGFVRVVLSVIGIVAVPLTNHETNPVWGNKQDPAPRSWWLPGAWSWLRTYSWHAMRNPTNNLRYLYTEPKLKETYNNPDEMVRDNGYISYTRFINEGWLFFEYWKVWATPYKMRKENCVIYLWKRYGWKGDKNYERKTDDSQQYSERRYGWKYSGVPGFILTFQNRTGG